MVHFSLALKWTIYNFKNSFFPNFLLIHRAKYILSRAMFCQYHYRAKIHCVKGVWKLIKHPVECSAISIIVCPFANGILLLWILRKTTFANKSHNQMIVIGVHVRQNLHCKYLQPIYSHWLCYISHCNLAVMITANGYTRDTQWRWGVQFEINCCFGR